MCDALFQKISSADVAAVGRSQDETFTGVTSLQYADPAFGGFAASSVKLSKNGWVAVLGSRRQNDSDSDQSQRPGVHIFLPKARKTNAKVSGDDWQWRQSIVSDTNGQIMDIDSVAVSEDGRSIVALDRASVNNTPQIYCITRQCGQADAPLWRIEQSLKRADADELVWENMALNDDHTRMVLRKKDTMSDQYQFCVYKRERSVSKRANVRQSRDGFKFRQIQTIETGLESGQTSTENFAMSHNGNTLAFLVLVDSTFYVHQYEFNNSICLFEKVSEFAVDSTENAVGIVFGGRRSERLFVLSADANSNSASVDVHDRTRENDNANCVQKCSDNTDLDYFSQQTKVQTVDNVSLGGGSLYRYRVLADPVDGDFFAVVATQVSVANQMPRPEPIFVSMWRSCSKDPQRWAPCNLGGLTSLADARCYQVDEFDTFSFRRDCQRYCLALGQVIKSVSFEFFLRPLADEVFVSNPDGCFYINASVEDIVGLYYRVAGDRHWTLFADGQSNQKIDITAQNCTAKNIELAFVVKDTRFVSGSGFIPVAPDPSREPEFLLLTDSIPMRLCFSLVCFEKSANCAIQSTIQSVDCAEIEKRSLLGSSALRSCRSGKTCFSALPTRLYAASYTGFGGDSALHELVPRTGQACRLQALGDFATVVLATHPKTGIVYGIGSRSGEEAEDGNFLFRIDPNSGFLFEIGKVEIAGSDSVLFDLSFRPNDSNVILPNDALLYLVSGGLNSVVLSQVDVTNGNAITRGTIANDGSTSGHGLAVDADDRMYIALTRESNPSQPLLLELDANSAEVISESALTLRKFGNLASTGEWQRPAVTSLTYDQCADCMFALLDNGSETYDRVTPQFLACVDRNKSVLCKIGQTGPEVFALTAEARSTGICRPLQQQ